MLVVRIHRIIQRLLEIDGGRRGYFSAEAGAGNIDEKAFIHYADIYRPALVSACNSQTFSQIVSWKTEPAREVVGSAQWKYAEFGGRLLFALADQRVCDGIDRAVATTGNNSLRTPIQRFPHHARFLSFVERYQYAKLDVLPANELNGVLDVGFVGRLAMHNEDSSLAHAGPCAIRR